MASDSDSDWSEEDPSLDSDTEAGAVTSRVTGSARSLPELAELVGTELPLSSEVQRLESLSCCVRQCLVGHRAQLTQLVASLRSMTKEEQRTSLFNTIAMCAAAADASRPMKKAKTSSKPARERFTYMVPYVGNVCKETLQVLYGISHRTLHTVNLDTEAGPFQLYKDFLAPTYKKVKSIQKYQLFRITRNNPGVVECRRRPTSEPTLSTISSAPQHTLKDFRNIWESIPTAAAREHNPEKMVDMNAKIKPYVPKEFANDDLYAAPTAVMVEKTASIKKKRRDRAAARIAAKTATSDEGMTAVV